jgi:hypothetical protein
VVEIYCSLQEGSLDSLDKIEDVVDDEGNIEVGFEEEFDKYFDCSYEA